MMHEGTTDFLKMLTVVLAVAGFLYWLHSSFGPYYALGAVIITVILLFGTALFVLGGAHSHKIQKDTMDGIARFNAQDATIDRYRMQSLNHIAKANTFQVKADNQLKVLEAKKDLKLLPKHTEQNETETFWSSNETVDLDEWS